MQKLTDTSDNKIRIIHRDGKSVPGPMTPKKGTIFSLFNFSRAQTSGENITAVLNKPVPGTLRPDTPRTDLKAVKNWIALEEKVVHDYKEQKKLQPKSAVPLPATPRLDALRADLAAIKNRVALEKRAVHDPKEQKAAPSKSTVLLPKTPRPDLLRTGFSAVKNWVASWEKVVQKDKAQKKDWPKSAVPSPAMPRLDALRADLAAVKNWVALEEKIVHNYREPQTPQFKRAVPLPIASRPDTSRADLTAIKNRMALEEKVVHDYKEQKKLPPTRVVFLPKTPEKQSLPVVETFSAQKVISSSPRILKPKDPFREPEKIFSEPGKLLWALGWLLAGVLALLYIQGTLSSRETSERLSLLKNEKNQLEQSYAALQNVWEGQRAEIKWLNSELQDTNAELKTARSEIDHLRNTVQTQNAIITALKAQTQAFEKIIDEGGRSALSGAAAVFSSKRFSTGGGPVFKGEVTSVNDRRGFVVINMGAAQGAYPGRWVTISRNDRGVAVGRVDRVYATMSVAVLRNSGMLQVVQEGDSVFFS